MILFVEDDAPSRHVYAELLRSEGYQVAEAQDGAEALELFDKGAVDLVISDLVLPKLHGLNLVELIRSESPDMPIIVISGHLANGPGKMFFEDCAEFIEKPIDPAILTATVQRLLAAKV
jgi:CheY-like chemotaxis protein